MIEPQIDEAADAAYLSFSSNAVAETILISNSIVVDVDANGAVVGVEVIGISHGPMPTSKEWERLQSLGVNDDGRDALANLLSGAA